MKTFNKFNALIKEKKILKDSIIKISNLKKNDFKNHCAWPMFSKNKIKGNE